MLYRDVSRGRQAPEAVLRAESVGRLGSCPGARALHTAYVTASVALMGPGEHVRAEQQEGGKRAPGTKHRLSRSGDRAGSYNRCTGPQGGGWLFCCPLHLKDGEMCI